VTLEAIDAAPERQRALSLGYDLADLAGGEDLVAEDGQARAQVARALAELEVDGWIVWDWTRYAGDPQPEQPPPPIFDKEALRKVANVRITPEGYSAFAARQRLSGAGSVRELRPNETVSDPDDPRYDLFISHASEDKAAVARPLARALTALGFAVWYDEDVLEVGASLRRSIDAGLAQSRFGVVVFSQAFFEKSWPPRELDGLFARELAEGAEIILPLWHEVDEKFMTAQSPMLAGRFALRTEVGIPDIAERLSRRLTRERGEGELRARSRPVPPTPPRTRDQPAGGNGVATAPNATSTALDMRTDTIGMLRADDLIGLNELLRYERRRFDEGVLETLTKAGDDLQDAADPARLQPVDEKLWQLVDRRLGSLLPVLEYRPESLIPEIAALAELTVRSPGTRSPYTAWLQGPRWPVWLVTLILGTAAVALDEPATVVALWKQRTSYDSRRPLPAARLGGGAELGQALTRARGAQISGPVELWYPAFATRDSELLRTHYGEIMRGGDIQDSPLAFLSRAGDYLWLCGALAGRDEVDVIQFWSAAQVHPTLPNRLDATTMMATRLAEILDVEPAQLGNTLQSWIQAVQGPTA